MIARRRAGHPVARARRRRRLAPARDPDRDPVGVAPALAARPRRDDLRADRHLRAPALDRADALATSSATGSQLDADRRLLRLLHRRTGSCGGPVQWAYHLLLPWITFALAVRGALHADDPGERARGRSTRTTSARRARRVRPSGGPPLARAAQRAAAARDDARDGHRARLRRRHLRRDGLRPARARPALASQSLAGRDLPDDPRRRRPRHDGASCFCQPRGRPALRAARPADRLRVRQPVPERALEVAARPGADDGHRSARRPRTGSPSGSRARRSGSTSPGSRRCSASRADAPPCSAASSSSSGSTALHGPHQGAQKSTITGPGAASTSASKRRVRDLVSQLQPPRAPPAAAAAPSRSPRARSSALIFEPPTLAVDEADRHLDDAEALRGARGRSVSIWKA